VMRAQTRHFSSRGFTLLEVLMVVLVVGILSMAVLFGLNPGGPERHLNDEAERLAALLALAGSEAVMQNREYGLQLQDDGYQFLCLADKTQRWGQCTGDGLFIAHKLPEGLEIRVLTTSQMTVPKAPVTQTKPDASDDEEIQPDILLLSSGEASPGELEIRVIEEPSQRIQINLDEIGRVRWGDQIDQDEQHAG
jgi:general secretion pathway protein H